MGARSAAAAVAVFALAVGATGAAYVAAEQDAAVVGDADAVPLREFVSAQTRTCPMLQSGAGRTGWATAVAVPGVPGVTGPGTLGLGQLGKGEGTGAQTDAAGVTVELDAPERESAAVVAAGGGLAPGLAAGMLTSDDAGEGQGLASSACQQPGSQAWLVGGGAGEGQRDSLDLVNPTGTDAVVDIEVYGRRGGVDSARSRGIGVPARSSTSLRLDAVAPGLEDLVVHVRTKVGIVAATVRDDRMDGLTPRGIDVIAPAGHPRNRLLIPGLPAGSGDRRLILMAPDGAGEAGVEALTPDGPVPLLPDGPVALKPGHVVAVDIAGDLAGRAAALRVTSTTPVVASASASTDPDADAAAAAAEAVARAEQAVKEADGAAERKDAEAKLAKAETRDAIPPGEDIAWFSPVEVLRGAAAVTGLRAGLDARLLLTAPEGDASVEISLLAGGEASAKLRPSQQVDIRGGTTRVVRLDPPRGAEVYTAVVAAGRGTGPVVAAQVQSGDEGAITGYGLESLPAWVGLPAAQPDYSAG